MKSFKHYILASALALCATPLMAQEQETPPPDGPQLVLMPPPETEKPEDVGEPPTDPEKAKDWLTGIFHSMMDTDGNDQLSHEELRSWVFEAHFQHVDPNAFDGELQPAFPVTYWEFDDFVAELDNNVTIINFDALPTGPAVPTDFNLDKSLAGTQRTGYEWQSLGAIFYSPIDAALRTVSVIEHYPPPHMNDPMIQLFVSRPNSLTMGAAPYTPPLAADDNEDVVDEDDDSLVIELVSPVAGVGFYLIDQDPGGDTPPPGEGIVFRDINDAVITTIQPLPAAIYPNHQFIGVISYGTGIAKVEINEAAFNDDISIDHVVLSQ